jgi:hypothetical protein
MRLSCLVWGLVTGFCLGDKTQNPSSVQSSRGQSGVSFVEHKTEGASLGFCVCRQQVAEAVSGVLCLQTAGSRGCFWGFVSANRGCFWGFVSAVFADNGVSETQRRQQHGTYRYRSPDSGQAGQHRVKTPYCCTGTGCLVFLYRFGRQV